jgi:hypothetical protein
MDVRKATDALDKLRRYVDGRDYAGDARSAIDELESTGHSGIRENVGRFKDAMRARGQPENERRVEMLKAIDGIERYINWAIRPPAGI